MCTRWLRSGARHRRLSSTLLRRRLGVGLAFALALLVGALPGARAEVRADTPEKLDLGVLGAPSFESFSPRDGLPDGVVSVVGVDADGFAWAASPRGLYRFVGHRWQRHEVSGFGAIHRRMLLDDRGVLWVPSHDGGVARWTGEIWELLDTSSGLPTDHVYKVSQIEDGSGRLRTWMLTMDAGLYERRGARWRPDPGNPSLPKSSLLSMASTRGLFGEPRQWLGTGDHGLWFRREGDTEWRPFELEGMAPGQVEDLQRSVDAAGERLWISIFGQGLWRLGEDRVSRWSVESGDLRSNEVYTVAIADDHEGEVTAWIASRSGLVRVRGEAAETFDRRHGLQSDQIRGTQLWRSPEGDEVLWIATESGVARAVFTTDRWRTATLMGSGAIGVFGVLVEPDGRGGERLWVASSRDGLGLYEDGRWRRFSSATGDLPSDSLRLIERAADLAGEDALWLGPAPGHLVRIDEGPTFSTIDTPWPKEPGQELLDILARRHEGRRELWFATRDTGIYRWRDDGWAAFRPAGATGEWRTTALFEQIDADGRSWIWAGTNQGLARFDGSEWVLLDDVDGLPVRQLLRISMPPSLDGRQVLWIGSAFDGLTRLDVTDPLAPFALPREELPPPIDVTIYSATFDSRGRVYLCTNDGVQQLAPRSGGGWTERVFRRRDGMVHEECNTNAQLVDDHDRFWTGTLGGLTVFDPGSSTPGGPKRLRFVEARVDGSEVTVDGLRLEPGARELVVEFTLQSWQREDETRYRTHLVGVDPVPGPWTPQPTRTLAGLPPGDHTLRIEAVDYAGIAAAPLEVDFTVAPAWWQRRLAQAGLVVAGVLIVLGVAQWRTRRLRAQKERLETEVAARTEALNAANRRLLELSYTDALTGLANRRMLLEALHELAGAVNGTSSLCSLVFIDLDHFKAYNDRHGHPAGDEALRTVARSLLDCAPGSALVARYGGEEFACLLPGYDRDRAVELAERMRRDIERLSIEVPGRDERERATLSAGVASIELDSEADVHRLLREADAALYRAKNDGRNCVRS